MFFLGKVSPNRSNGQTDVRHRLWSVYGSYVLCTLDVLRRDGGRE